jgi:hypothetical protein
MNIKQRWHGIACIILLGFFMLLPGMTLLHGQETDPQTTKEEEKPKKEAPDNPGKKVKPTKEQTPEQTAAKRKEAEAREKAAAEAKAKAKAEAVAKEQTDETGEYVYTNVLVGTDPAASIDAAAQDMQKAKEYWQGLKATLDKNIVELKATLQQLQEKLLQTKMKYLSEASPLRQTELQNEINKLIENITNQENVLLNSEQLLKDLAEKARKAGVPPGWVR